MSAIGRLACARCGRTGVWLRLDPPSPKAVCADCYHIGKDQP